MFWGYRVQPAYSVLKDDWYIVTTLYLYAPNALIFLFQEVKDAVDVESQVIQDYSLSNEKQEDEGKIPGESICNDPFLKGPINYKSELEMVSIINLLV